MPWCCEDRVYDGSANLKQAHVNHGDDELTVTALRPIKAGEEILNYYGPHPNSELLRRYGYVTERHSRYDVVEIPWEMVEAATVSQLQLPQEAWAKVVRFPLHPHPFSSFQAQH